MELGVPEKICAYTRLSLIVGIEMKNSIPITQKNLIINVKEKLINILIIFTIYILSVDIF